MYIKIWNDLENSIWDECTVTVSIVGEVPQPVKSLWAWRPAIASQHPLGWVDSNHNGSVQEEPHAHRETVSLNEMESNWGTYVHFWLPCAEWSYFVV